jgi:hypothetical protein
LSFANWGVKVCFPNWLTHTLPLARPVALGYSRIVPSLPYVLARKR